VGPFTLDEARPLERIELLALPEAMRGFGSATVDADLAARVAVGAGLGPEELLVSGPPPWAVLDELGSLLAVYEPHRDGVRTKPAVVIPPL